MVRLASSRCLKRAIRTVMFAPIEARCMGYPRSISSRSVLVQRLRSQQCKAHHAPEEKQHGGGDAVH